MLTKQQAKQIAETRTQQIIDIWLANGITLDQLKGANAPMTQYEDQEDFQTLRPEDQPSTIQEHQLITKYSAQILKEKYSMNVIPITINASDYFRWLAKEKLPNNAGNRAKYTAIQHQQTIINKQ
jgi:hypothetical protein